MKCILRYLHIAILSVFFGASSSATFPRYPDEWEWIIPPLERGQKLEQLHARLLDNGEVLMDGLFRADGEKPKRKLWLLFSQHAMTETFDGNERLIADGKPVKVIAEASQRAEIGNKFVISSLSRAYRQCYRGPVRSIVLKQSIDGTSVARSVLLFLLNEPRTFVGGGGHDWSGEENASCPDEGPVHVTYRVAALSGLFLALPDGTALMIDEENAVVVRIPSDMTARRVSRSGRVFSFDYHDNDLLVDELTSKQYESIGDTPPYQEIVDDLYLYLRQQKRN